MSFIAEGVKIVNEAIQNDSQSVDRIIYTSACKDEIKLSSVNDNTKLLEVSSREFQQISSQDSPQGVLAVIKKQAINIPEASKLEDISFALDKLRDPGNFGTIIRLADWFGIKQLFCSTDTVDCYNPKVVQSSMGAIFRVNIHYVDLNKFLLNIQQSGLHRIYGTSLSGSNIFEAKLSKPAIVIFGNESGGLSGELMSIADQNLCIPNFSKNMEKSESLNVSTAAAIICAEFRRQNP